jgi:hypothetical protein
MITKRLFFDFGQELILPKHKNSMESMPPCTRTFFVHGYKRGVASFCDIYDQIANSCILFMCRASTL